MALHYESLVFLTSLECIPSSNSMLQKKKRKKKAFHGNKNIVGFPSLCSGMLSVYAFITIFGNWRLFHDFETT